MDILGYFDNYKRPRILIKIEYKDRKKEYEALLDSGADYSLLPKHVGIQLGLKLPDKPNGYSTGIGGRSPVKHITLKVYFGKKMIKLKFAWLFSRDDLPVIIGRKGIFDRFDIEFKQKENKIILRKS